MKFVIDDPNDETEFECTNSWIIVDNYKDIKEILILGVLVGIILAGITSFFIKGFSLCSNFEFSAYKRIYLFILVIPLHELVHLIAFPNIGNSKIGFSWRKLIFFVSTDEIISRNRFLVISIFPLIMLTIFPIISLFFYESEFVAYFALYNLIGSGIDIVSFVKIMGLSKNKLLKFHGTKLYAKD